MTFGCYFRCPPQVLFRILIVIGLFYKVLDRSSGRTIKVSLLKDCERIQLEGGIHYYSIIMLDGLFDMTYMSMTLHMYARQSIHTYV